MKAKKRWKFCRNKRKKSKGLEQSVKTANNNGNKNVNIDNSVNNDVNIDYCINNDDVNMDNFKQYQQFQTEKPSQYTLQ